MKILDKIQKWWEQFVNNWTFHDFVVWVGIVLMITSWFFDRPVGNTTVICFILWCYISLRDTILNNR